MYYLSRLMCPVKSEYARTTGSAIYTGWVIKYHYLLFEHYLAVVPTLIEVTEAEYRSECVESRNPVLCPDSLEEEIARIKADPVQMEVIQATVKERTRSKKN